MPLHRSAEIGEQRCPACGHAVNAAADVGGEQHAPKPGDVSVCIYCAELLVFTEDSLRLPTQGEMADFRRTPRIMRAKAAVISMLREMDD